MPGHGHQVAVAQGDHPDQNLGKPRCEQGQYTVERRPDVLVDKLFRILLPGITHLFMREHTVIERRVAQNKRKQAQFIRRIEDAIAVDLDNDRPFKIHIERAVDVGHGGIEPIEQVLVLVADLPQKRVVPDLTKRKAEIHVYWRQFPFAFTPALPLAFNRTFALVSTFAFTGNRGAKQRHIVNIPSAVCPRAVRRPDAPPQEDDAVVGHR